MKRNKIMKVLLLALSIAALLSVGCFAAEVGESFAYNTLWAALPPIIAIGLALITKEVYSSLFIGILVYNFAVRFIPFIMKLLARLFRAGFRAIRNGYQVLKGAVEEL